MISLDFARRDLDALDRFFGEQSDALGSEWHITHVLFFPSEETRNIVETALEAHGMFVSYRDTIDDELRPFWLDIMEPVPPEIGEIEARMRRVLAVLSLHDGEYNSFSIIGSRGESFPS